MGRGWHANVAFYLEDVVRVMRALTFKGVFVETAQGYFAHTSGSAAIRVPGIEAMIGH